MSGKAEEVKKELKSKGSKSKVMEKSSSSKEASKGTTPGVAAEKSVEMKKPEAGTSTTGDTIGRLVSEEGKMNFSQKLISNLIKATKSDQDHMSGDSSFVISKATELFIAAYVKAAVYVMNSDDDKKTLLTYDHLAEVVQNDPAFSFLSDAVPPKITYAKAMELVENANAKRDSEINEILFE